MNVALTDLLYGLLDEIGDSDTSTSPRFTSSLFFLQNCKKKAGDQGDVLEFICLQMSWQVLHMYKRINVGLL